jgi:biopolymer transport protein ExbD/biopolymer transport protein TolR
MGASLSSGSARQPEPDINITPLVDVVLVLLIIFMVIAPAIVQGEHVDLPAIDRPDPKPRDIDPIEVTMAANGALIVEDERIQPAQLWDRLQKFHAADPKRALMLKSDSSLPYAKVRETFALVQKIGFKGVSLQVIERRQAGEG